MYNLEGANSRTRTGMSLSLGIARDLGLHRLDHPTFRRHHPLEVADKIDLEIKRRIWWHLSVTDWYVLMKPLVKAMLIPCKGSSV